jgi:hypothetical protein
MKRARTSAKGRTKTSFSTSKVATSHYPLRKFKPQMFSRKFNEPFYIIPRFIDRESVDEVKERVLSTALSPYPPTVGLHHCVFLAFSENELEEAKKLIQQEPWVSSNVLFALPHIPGDFYDLLKEMYALEELMGDTDQSLQQGMLENLERCVRNYLNLEHLSWHWKGSEIFPKGMKGKNMFFSVLLNQIYGRKLAFPLKSSKKGRKDATLKALSIILDFRKPLILAKKGGSRAQALLRDFLEKNIISENTVDTGAFKTYDIRTTVPLESPAADCWEVLTNVLIEKGNKQSTRPGELFAVFKEPPYGISHHCMLLLLALFWRAHHPHLKLIDTSDESGNEIEVNAQSLLELLGSPWKKEIYYELLSETEAAFLAEIMSMLKIEGKSTPAVEKIEDAYHYFGEWMKAHSSQAGAIMKAGWEGAGELISHFRGQIDDVKARHFLWEFLPSRLNIDSFDINAEESRDELISRLKEFIETSQSLVATQREQTLQMVGSLFGIEEPTESKIFNEMKVWALSKDCDTEKLSTDVKALMEVLKTSREGDDFIFGSLPKAWDMKESTAWERDRYSELAYRVWAARFEIDFCKFRGLLSVTDRADSKSLAQTLIARYLDYLSRNEQEKECHILDITEKLLISE